jgi:hypothetical protein
MVKLGQIRGPFTPSYAESDIVYLMAFSGLH